MFKKYSKEIALVILLLAVSGLILFQQTQKDKALGNQFSSAYKILNGTTYPTSNSKYAFLTTSTSTYSFELSELSDQVDFELYTIASTTASCNCTPVLGWTIEQSDDNVNFFIRSTNSTSGKTTTFVEDSQKWQPPNTATSSLKFSIANPNSKYLRINVSAWSATGTVFSHIGFWGQVIIRRPY